MSVTLALLSTLATIPPVHAIVWALMRAWRSMSGRLRHDAAGADAILLASVAPAVLGAAAALLVTLPAFVFFEPSGQNEGPGVLMSLSAAVGAAYVLIALARALSVIRLSRRCLAEWMPGASAVSSEDWGLPAYAIDATFPVVAVAGSFRPRLLIDRRVLEACSAEELCAIAGHERAHVEHQDNLRRLLLSACVGSNSASAQQWRHAAEVAADERAASDPDRGAVLAGALIKIARLAANTPPHPIPFTAIHDGGALELRVQRLLTITPLPARRRWRAPLVAAVAVLSVTMAAQGTEVLRGVHSFIEILVRSH